MRDRPFDYVESCLGNIGRGITVRANSSNRLNEWSLACYAIANKSIPKSQLLQRKFNFVTFAVLMNLCESYDSTRASSVARILRMTSYDDGEPMDWKMRSISTSTESRYLLLL